MVSNIYGMGTIDIYLALMIKFVVINDVIVMHLNLI